MNAAEALNIQLAALVAVHGLPRVQRALARIDNGQVPQLNNVGADKNPQERPASSAKKIRRRKDVDELLDEAGVASSIRSLVADVAHAYEQKAFLPDLWRVRKFLESAGIDASNVRSRSAARPKVVQVLALQPRERLQELLAESKSNRGELEILTDHILGSRPSGTMAPQAGLRESSASVAPRR